jgi:nicotinamide-nucleotide amidase
MILPNRNGTAPGIWLDVDGRIVVLLPGPPREMQPIFEHAVRPQLEARTGARGVRRRVIKMTGRAESQVEETAQPVYSVMAQWPVPIETTILASPGQIELHLSAREEDAAAADATLDRAVAALVDCLGDIVFSIDGRNLPEVVGDLLGERGYRIAVAESCTGGLVLGRLTDVPGSSAWVIGGVVAYSNDVKEAQLGVPAETLAQHGAVSEPVGEAMASGVRARLGADIGVAITGIAGPSGGSDAKPVGTVVIAADAPSGRRVRTFRFLGDRAMVRQQATQAALEMVRRLLLER